jgi:heat shock protein HtpX
MSKPIDEFHAGVANWREVIKRNNRRTMMVISIFILLYVALGLLVDMFIYSQHYKTVPLNTIFHALITLQLTPYATIITTLIAIISLFVAFKFHDRIMLLGTEYHEVTPENASNLKEKQLYNIIEEMKVAAGLQYMPRVFIIEADYMNAFASGYSEKSAMVAITRGLMDKLDRDELQAVMAHELSHIRHMDIKLTLMASVLSNIMLIVIDILFWSAFFSSDRSRREEGGGGNWLVIVIIVLRYVLPLLTMLLMLFLSRSREYMADAGCVELTRTNEPLARALLKIQGDHEDNIERYSQEYAQTPHDSIRREAYIFDPIKAGIEAQSSLSDMFSTHPSIEKRLAALGFKRKS